MKKIVLFCLIVLQTLVASEYQHDRDALEQQVILMPNDANLRANLSVAYYQSSIDEKSESLMFKSYNEINKAIELQPDNQRFHTIKYMIGSMLFIVSKKESILSEITPLYNDAKIINPEIQSPSYLKLIVSDGKTLKQIIDLGLQAIKENSNNVNAYSLVSNAFLKEKKYDLAIDIVKRGLKKNPNNYGLLISLGMAYEEKINAEEESGGCYLSDSLTGIHKEQLEVLKQIVKIDSSSESSKRLLISKFSDLGYDEQAVYMAKRLFDNNKSNENANEYLFVLANKDSKKALELFGKNAPYSNLIKDNSNLQNVMFSDGRWSDYVDFYENKKKDDYFYGFLRYAIAKGFLKANSSEETIAVLVKRPINIKPNDWEQKILDYMVNKISKDELLQQSKHKCHLTEANFFIGIKEWQSGNKINALKYFEKVRDIQVYPYVEYQSSKNYINILKQHIKQ